MKRLVAHCAAITAPLAWVSASREPNVRRRSWSQRFSMPAAFSSLSRAFLGSSICPDFDFPDGDTHGEGPWRFFISASNVTASRVSGITISSACFDHVAGTIHRARSRSTSAHRIATRLCRLIPVSNERVKKSRHPTSKSSRALRNLSASSSLRRRRRGDCLNKVTSLAGLSALRPAKARTARSRAIVLLAVRCPFQASETIGSCGRKAAHSAWDAACFARALAARSLLFSFVRATTATAVLD